MNKPSSNYPHPPFGHPLPEGEGTAHPNFLPRTKEEVKIGIIGGGQLGQMMALAAYPLGLKVICLDSDPHCPASRVADIIVGDYHSTDAVKKLSQEVDIVTYEFENLSASALIEAETAFPHIPFFPSLTALQTAQDRLLEKQLFDKLNIPTTRYIEVYSLEDVKKAASHISLPAVLKTRFGGYDGKGQMVLKEKHAFWEEEIPSLLENYISFDREISCIAARNQTGEIVFYALIENEHRNGVLRESRVLEKGHPLEKQAHLYLTKILEAFNYVGVLTVEFFEKEGRLIANEMAPRVHNSGHWTIEGADTSQFENHIRAVCGLPLGSTDTRGHVRLFNLIGETPQLETILDIPHAHYHLYGKSPRPGRKLGHITLATENPSKFESSLTRLKQVLP